MFIKNWKRELFTIPNLLSLLRLALIPIYTSLYLHAREPKDFVFSGLILAVSCLTDFLDGIIARRFGMISNIGKVLDPLADKATQLALILCLLQKYTALLPVVSLFAIKEIFQLVVCIFFFRNGKVLPGALPAGKICTAVLFASLILLVLFPALPQSAVNTLAAVDDAFLLTAFVCYVSAYFGRNKKVQSFRQK